MFNFSFMHTVSQLCPALCDPVNCSLPGSSVHGISQARILGWVAISSSRRSSRSRDRTRVPASPAWAGRSFTVWATREAPDPSRITGSKNDFSILIEPHQHPFCLYFLWCISERIPNSVPKKGAHIQSKRKYKLKICHEGDQTEGKENHSQEPDYFRKRHHVKPFTVVARDEACLHLELPSSQSKACCNCYDQIEWSDRKKQDSALRDTKVLPETNLEMFFLMWRYYVEN